MTVPLNEPCVRAAVVGAAGYTGRELIRILLRHRRARLTVVVSGSHRGPLSDLWPEFTGRTKLACEPLEPKTVADRCDVVFTAVPHTRSMDIVPEFLKRKKRVIDLSADYRLPAAVYRKAYQTAHRDKRNLKHAVYGLCELHREQIKRADLVANPGCYSTAVILGLAPLAGLDTDVIESVVVDAKSGASGAGRKTDEGLMFCGVNENLKPYNILTHRHTPEMELIIGRLMQRPVAVGFVPHLVPMDRGILATIYVRLKQGIAGEKLFQQYRRFYKAEPFVRVLDKGLAPETKHVAHTNLCLIGLTWDNERRLLVITSAIDNLIKGAAGQAVQNMNVMFQLPETEGLL